jgi:hypothetical protein
MNILSNNPAASLHIAQQTVADRLDEARVRRRTRALRAERHAAPAARPAAERPASSSSAPSATPRVARVAR